MRPQTTALLDQADAASGHAAQILHTIATMRGDQVQHRYPGPVYAAVVARFQQRAMAGQVGICQHLSYTAPEPAFWCAWAPGRVRCAACTERAQRRVRGTREDRRCDHCGYVGRTIHADMAQLPAVVIDLPPWPPRCVPPITAIFGLCARCQQADTAAAQQKEPA